MMMMMIMVAVAVERHGSNPRTRRAHKWRDGPDAAAEALGGGPRIRAGRNGAAPGRGCAVRAGRGGAGIRASAAPRRVRNLQRDKRLLAGCA